MLRSFLLLFPGNSSRLRIRKGTSSYVQIAASLSKTMCQTKNQEKRSYVKSAVTKRRPKFPYP